jgi:hypothetical protein
MKTSSKGLLLIGLAFIAITAYPVTGLCDNAKKDPDNAIIGNPPPTSLFSKVALGMSAKQVTDLIGQPTDQKFYQTGKVWIPFYHGTDAARLEYHYKGEGIITLTGGTGMGGGAWTVYRVIYDPNESGYVHN